MATQVEINPGEIQVKLNNPISGKVSFQELGISNDDLYLKGGLLRLVFNLKGIGEHSYFKVPTIEVSYEEEVGETRWVCEFNDETILDKKDHHGRSTVVLLNRNKISELEHRHENKLIVHAEFPTSVHLIAEKSFITLFN
jgi:hypothetical protein